MNHYQRHATFAVLLLGLAACTATATDSGDTGAVRATALSIATGQTRAERAGRRGHDNRRDWLQWGQNARHTGAAPVTGQPFARQLADVVYDPLAPDEQAATGGDLFAHYQTPLVDGADVYMERKTGTYDVAHYDTQTWSETKSSWVHDALVQRWTFVTDWVAPGSAFDFWEPVFHPVLANGRLYVPGKGGTIQEIDKETGVALRRISPFSEDCDAPLDPHKFTVSPITADDEGSLYFNVIELVDDTRASDFYDQDAVDSWLVKVARNGRASRVSYKTLTPHAPKAGDVCEQTFFNPVNQPFPWPPSPTAVPPTEICDAQRVALNVAPAVDRDGTIYSVTRGHRQMSYGYLVAINPDLTPKWDVSLRDRFFDGCGVPPEAGGALPPNGAPGGCREGARYGINPGSNRPGDGMIFDDTSASPVVAPDGSIFFGAATRYNYGQGHLMHFARSGDYLGAYPFGWDTTPAIYPHDGTYSVVTKENHYDLLSYCGNPKFCPIGRTATNPGSPTGFFITQLSPSLQVEWQFKATNTESCQRDASGQVACTSDHPEGFEWCVNMAAVDADGVVYANSEDGFLYAIRQGGTLKESVFQRLALGAAYTPASLGPDGRVYSQNAGHLFVMGR